MVVLLEQYEERYPLPLQAVCCLQKIQDRMY